jgi:5-methylcytosine-specific restriction endonuclease McrA
MVHPLARSTVIRKRHPFATRHGRQARARILVRDQWRCHWCGRHANTVDHLIPISEGGSHYDPRNLVAACAHCNKSRGGKIGGRITAAKQRRTDPTGRKVWNGAIRPEEN